MNSTKLGRVFSLLNAYERNEFNKFLLSPFFNRREDVLKLYRILIASSGQEEIEKERIWEKIFPETTFQNADFNRLANRLLGLLETYLSNRQKTSHEINRRIALAQYYHSHQAKDLTQAIYKKEKKRIDEAKERGTIYFLDRYILSREIYNASAPRQKRHGQGLHQLSLDLDEFYFLEKLKQACSLAAQKNVSSEVVRLDLLKEVLERVESPNRPIPPILRAYAFAYRMMESDEGVEEFEQLLHLLEQRKSQIPPDDQRAVYLMAINFCIQQLNRGQVRYLREVYNLYKIGLNDKWLFEQETLSLWTYKNIVSAGLKLEEFKEVTSFIDNYRDRLPEEARENHHRYNLAELQMAQGQYREVLRSLRFLQFKDPLTQLRSRILLVKASLELGDHPLAEYQLVAFRKLLIRRKSLAYHRENYLQFVRIVGRILLLEPGDDASRLAIRQEVELAEAVVERHWLLEKVANFR